MVDVPKQPVEERRSSPRTEYSATAIVYLGNEQFTCRIADLSRTGLLVFPPVRRGSGTFVRLNISLPALEQVLDVDGFVMREAERDGYYTWGVQFHQPSARAAALIETYVEWDRKREAAAEEPGLSSISVEIEKKGTGQDFPVVEIGEQSTQGEVIPQEEPAPPEPRNEPDPASPPEMPPHWLPPKTQEKTGEEQTITSKFRAVQARQRMEADERWQARKEREEAQKDLRDLYAEALKNL